MRPYQLPSSPYSGKAADTRTKHDKRRVLTAGSVTARELAEAGWRVHVIDRRPHLAGNAYDEPDAPATCLPA